MNRDLPKVFSLMQQLFWCSTGKNVKQAGFFFLLLQHQGEGRSRYPLSERARARLASPLCYKATAGARALRIQVKT